MEIDLGPSDPATSLREGRIVVLSASLDGDLPDAEALLEPDELAARNRLRDAVDRKRAILARAFLRRSLAAIVAAPPAALRFDAGPHGKPSLPSAPGLQFNLSHSEDRALLALSRRGPVGCDLERIRPLAGRDRLVRRFFAADEAEHLLALPEAERDAAFFDCWTIKEAVVKALGGGISMGFAQFSVAFASRLPPRILALRWPGSAAIHPEIRRIDFGPEWAAAIALADQR